ncbi:hypothetical protein [Halocatena halophila]|uniref:hypothetical protein n=1 Tax=Halocatena halophila TaxID=2814576 RepID=UPI002ED3AC6C
MTRSVRSKLYDLTGIEGKSIEAIVIASLFGAFQAIIVFHFGDVTGVKMIGASAGHWDKITGGLMVIVYSLIFGGIFLGVIAGSVNPFVTRVIMLSQNSALLQKFLVPLLTRSALGVTLLAIGQLYGIIIGLVFHGILLQLWLEAIGAPAQFPAFGLASTVAWMAYGATMGLVYGLLMEQ